MATLLMVARIPRRACASLFLSLALLPCFLGTWFLLQTSPQREIARRRDVSFRPTTTTRRFEDETVCFPWSTNSDEWWLNHPTHVVTADNATHTCFQRIRDSSRSDFLQSLHARQWKTSCEQTVQTLQISSGYAAALSSVARSMYATYKSGKALQITKAHELATWNFATRNHSHWAYCATEDLNCYFLPLSPCPPTLGRSDAARGAKPSRKSEQQEFEWLRLFAFRPKHIVRERLQQYRDPQFAHVSPCTAIHVRRGDIAFGKGRRYAAVSEYLEAGHVAKGSTVVLLTDDETTIDEVEQHHAQDYHWVYFSRARFRGSEGGFEGFIPSQDPAEEVLAILAESELAAQCNVLVHGKSGFVAVLVDAFEASGHPFELVYLNTQQDKASQPKMDPRDRASAYLATIAETNRIDKT